MFRFRKNEKVLIEKGEPPKVELEIEAPPQVLKTIREAAKEKVITELCQLEAKFIIIEYVHGKEVAEQTRELARLLANGQQVSYGRLKELGLEKSRYYAARAGAASEIRETARCSLSPLVESSALSGKIAKDLEKLVNV